MENIVIKTVECTELPFNRGYPSSVYHNKNVEVQVEIGPRNGGSNVFYANFITENALVQMDYNFVGGNIIIVKDLSEKKVKIILQEILDKCIGYDWDSTVNKLRKYLEYEFE